MYDNTSENNITAYNFNLTSGYVVVSAYSDVENIIPEWSDKATPLYQELEISSGDKVIYLGGYEYYSDNGNGTVKGISGENFQKTQLVNTIDTYRDISNISDVYLQKYTSETTASTNYIENPKEHADNNYNDIYDLVTNIDWYANYADNIAVTSAITDPYFDTDFALALSNAAYAFKEFHGYKTNLTKETVFNDVVSYGYNNSYYNPYTPGGVSYSNEYNYVNNFFNYYFPGSDVAIYEESFDSNWSNTTFLFSQFKGLFIHRLQSHSIYGTHTVMSYGVIRYLGRTHRNYISYLRVADGLTSETRYITLASVVGKYTIQILKQGNGV